VPSSELWIAPAVTGKFVELVDPVTNASLAVSTAIEAPLSLPPPPRYEK